jgi:hypothetical protein
VSNPLFPRVACIGAAEHRSRCGRFRHQKDVTENRRIAMADRHRSSDGSRDTEKILGAEGSVSGKGREGGRLSRQLGSKDEKKRAFERPAGATRVTKSVEEEDKDG